MTAQRCVKHVFSHQFSNSDGKMHSSTVRSTRKNLERLSEMRYALLERRLIQVASGSRLRSSNLQKVTPFTSERGSLTETTHPCNQLTHTHSTSSCVRHSFGENRLERCFFVSNSLLHRASINSDLNFKLSWST